MSTNKLFNIPTDIFPEFVDKYMGTPVIFTLLVIFQGCFGSLGVGQTPKRLSKLSNSPVIRICFILAIAYTATTDIETALISTTAFFIFLHLLRTKEEFDEFGSYI
jgi:hypothetical protein